MKAVKRITTFLIFTILVLLFITARLSAYPDPRLSIGHTDSPGYLASAEQDFPSWAFFTSRRPAGISLIYKLLEPENGYTLTTISKPAAGENANIKLVYQPGLDRITLFQTGLSIFAWVTLSLTAAAYLKKPGLKILSVIVILLFALTPQVSDWDYILGSESISFSLFVLLMAVSLRLTMYLLQSDEAETDGLGIFFTVLAWLIILIFLSLTRDNTPFLILPTILLIITGLMVAIFWHKRLIFLYLFLITALIGIYTFNDHTSKESQRWYNSYFHVVRDYIIKYPARLEFFEARGMPEFNSPEFQKWSAEQGLKVYAQFLIASPGFTTLTFIDHADLLFSENMQPYFYLDNRGTRKLLLTLGNALHPLSSFPLLLIPMLTIGFILTFISKPDPTTSGWCWFLIWLVTILFVNLFISFFGDTAGVVRHVIGSIMPLRLLVWLFPIIIFDQITAWQNAARVFEYD